MPTRGLPLVLKENEVFIVTDETRSPPPGPPFGPDYEGTRYLSVLNYQIEGQNLVLLNATSGQNYMGRLYAANDWLTLADGTRLLPQTISLTRERFVRGGLHERATITNSNLFPVRLTVSV